MDAMPMLKVHIDPSTVGALRRCQVVGRWRSDDARRAYVLTLFWPAGAAPAGGYPLVVMLDGAWVADATAQVSSGIAVALLMHEGDLDIVKAARAFDFTPPLASAAAPAPADPRTPRWRNGGADAFLKIFDMVMLPWVLAQAPIDSARVTAFGHSYAGLCLLRGLYGGALTQVTRCVLASPSVWWHYGAVDQVLPQIPSLLPMINLVASRAGIERAGMARALRPIALFLAGEHERWHAQAVGPDATISSREGGCSTLEPIARAAARWAATGDHAVYLATVPRGTHRSMLAQAVAPAFEFARPPRVTLDQVWHRMRVDPRIEA
jgi:predicted alpha/beta superfamily hydrolase